MSQPTPEQLLRGTDAPRDVRVDLVAGHVRAVLDGVDLRELRIAGGAVPSIDRVYVAVRDPDWDTIPAVVTDLRVEPGESCFRVTFGARHGAGDIDFAWHGLIEGEADGQIRYTMRGQAATAFDYCRIGFCVLHPDALAGSAFTARTANGPVEGALPNLVAPQLIVDGFDQPIIPPFHELVVRTADGVSIETTIAGDLFETEDQRNWTDASFKSYCTPLSLGYPHRAEPGQPFEQVVTIRLRPATVATPAPVVGGVSAIPSDGVARLDIGSATGRSWPAVGLGMASDVPGLTAREETLLRALRIDHLRVDVRPSRPGWVERVDEAVRQATQLECGLEVALFVPAAGSDERPGERAAGDVAERLGDARVARWLVFDASTAGTGTTRDGLARQVRDGLGRRHSGVPIAGGTDGDFAELNRSYPAPDGLDALVYSINPQVHASDDRSILETVTAQAATVATARSNAEGRGICISPVTLAPRFNPMAMETDGSTPAGELPRAVDPRQMSLLGAAWAVASMAALASSGARSVTWFETVGWRGLIEREAGSPDGFPSSPGMAFPMYHAFADLAEMRGGELLHVSSSAPRSLAGLAVRRAGRVNGLLANLTPEELRIEVGPVGEQVLLRVLDASTVDIATGDPDAFRRFGSAIGSDGGRFDLTLAPYAVVVFGTAA